MANYKVITETSPLNLRSEANANSAVLATIPKGTVVKENFVLQAVPEWIAVSYGQNTGYVSALYVEKTTEPVINDTTTATVTDNTINNNQKNEKMALTLSENAKKYIKIGLIGLGVAAAGFAVYKITKRGNQSAIAPRTQASLPASTLSGTSRRKRSKKRATAKKKKSVKLT
jgi:hypothetical protein